MAVLSPSLPAQPSTDARLQWKSRCAMGAVTVAGSALLGIAAWLTPSAEGFGTHTQLGIAPCSWPATVGIPCPSCGMTTAFACAADGRFVDSLRAQPAGFLLAVATAGLTVACAYAALTGSRLVSALGDSMGAWGWWIVGGILLASWAYKIAAVNGVLP